MCARKATLRFSDEARQDIRDIPAYTAKTWGKEQRALYRGELDRAFSRLSDYPNIGEARDDFLKGARGWTIGQHLVLYIYGNGVVSVLRVVHVRMGLLA